MIPSSLIFIFCKIKHAHAKMQALNCASNLQFVPHTKNYEYMNTRFSPKHENIRKLKLHKMIFNLMLICLWLYVFLCLAGHAFQKRLQCDALMEKYRERSERENFQSTNTYIHVVITSSQLFQSIAQFVFSISSLTKSDTSRNFSTPPEP